MSLYLSLSTLEDKDIVNTVNYAINNADDPDSLFIGIAATTGEKFYDEYVSQLSKLGNVKTKLYDVVADRGIGNGRNNARFAYDGQKYIMQVDSHTFFDKGWDSLSKNILDESIAETGNEKTVATGYMPPYMQDGNKFKVLDNRLEYSVYIDENRSKNLMLKKWITGTIPKMPDEYVTDRSKPFYPANKIGADCTIGNSFWAEYSGLPRNIIFWEEEVVQSINLLNKGFSLVYPNREILFAHRYWGHTKMDRQATDDLYEDPVEKEINNNVRNFVAENKDACKKYAEYCGYDLDKNILSGKIFPDTYGF